MQIYYAKSMFVSKTNWLAVLSILLNVLELKDVINLVPDIYLPYVNALTMVLVIILRGRTTNPVAFIPPGHVKPVSVKSLEAK